MILVENQCNPVDSNIMKTHMFKPHTCDTCRKSFTSSSYLRVHERTHTGLKPHLCDTCGKSFTQSCILTHHERTHTGVKPYHCHTCGYSFTTSSYLRVHERMQTYIKYFACDTCEKNIRSITWTQSAQNNSRTGMMINP